MDKELHQLQKLFSSEQVRVEKCGIGKVNAALGAQRMINEFQPDVIISSGCAGGHGEDIRIQDVVVSTELSYHDVYCGTAIDNTTVYGQVQGCPARFPADPELLRIATNLQFPLGSAACYQRDARNSNLQLQIHPGLIVTGDWFVDSKEKMRDIIGKFPEAKAVDMESAAIAHTCYLNKVRFISFRVISDLPLEDTDASMYHDFWNQIADNSFQVTQNFVNSLLSLPLNDNDSGS